MSWMIRMWIGSLLTVFLAGCAASPTPVGDASLFCPPLKKYSMAERRALKQELLACKNCKTVKMFLIVYRQLRRQIHACRK